MIGIFKSDLFKRILNVGFFQTIAHVSNAATGFLVIRALDKEHYAVYALFYSLLSAIVVVSGVGIHIGMSVIGGRVWKDRWELGSLVRTLERLRMTLFKWLLPLFAGYTFWLFYENNISLWFAAFVLAVVLAIVWLQIHANLKFDIAKLLNRTDIINRFDMIPALVRLATVAAILFLAPGNVHLILLVTLLSYVIQYFMVNRLVNELYDPTAPVNAEYSSETISLMKPDIVNTLYLVVQGQISIVLMSIFLNTSSISDVTVLGRITVVLAILHATLSATLMPVFAKEQDLGRLKTKFFQSSVVYLALLSGICAVAFFFPEPLLWILGEKYANLKRELFVTVMGSCFYQYVAFMYGIIAAKGWMKYQWLYTPLTILNHIILILTLDLHSQMGIIWFGTLGNCGFFAINCISLMLGFSKRGAKPGFA